MVESASRTLPATRNLIIRYRPLVVTAFYIVQAVLANYLAFFLRFEWAIPPDQVLLMLRYLPYLVAVRLVFYFGMRLNRDLWRYSSISSLVKIAASVSAGSAVFVVLVRYVFGEMAYPRSIYILDWMMLIFFAGGARLSVRVLREYLQSEASGRRVLIVGAGNAGEMIVRDMRNNPRYSYKPVGFIDDDPYKKGLSIHGVPILGPMSLIERIVRERKPEEIIVCIPSASNRAIRKIYETCKPFNVTIKTLPGLSDILSGDVSVSQIKPLSMEDLLQREPVRTDIQSVREYIGGRRVMVTGAGGSIGSELSRQIIKYGPSELVLLDRYENGLFEIDMELRREGPGERVVGVIGDILDERRLEYLFRRHRPQMVFHAAAHKHVPLMESNPIEAVKNNVFGSGNLIDVSGRHGVESFVMVSTDKAVNPTNIMGATKRMAELLVLDAASRYGTKFTTVRFGNVLGSNGSVIHVFKEQIARGGPVTVTHPEIKRFFMLIPEAVQLVLIAASTGKGGEIFVLDMGEPIRIVDFAENAIRLSGFVPEDDIRIEFTGLRPGEKLYEELFDDTERMVGTSHEKLRIAVTDPPSPDEINDCMAALREAVERGSEEEIYPVVGRLVPGYRAAQG
jgi:FlaA1/EpsC-like NDP-sugar epimerase